MKFKDCIRDKHDSHDYAPRHGEDPDYFYSYNFLRKADWDMHVELWNQSLREGKNLKFDRDAMGIICDRIARLERIVASFERKQKK